MIFSVRRLNITGPLDEYFTPIEVIKQCMTSHGFEPIWERIDDIQDIRYRRKCIQKISSITTPLVIRDMRKAARYVNCQTIFQTEDSLMEAIKHLFQWETIERIDIYELRRHGYGPITNENPLSMDCTILYRLCRMRGLRTKPEHTSEDMFRMLCIELTVPTKMIQDILIDTIQTLSSVELINHFYSWIPTTDNLSKEDLYLKYIHGRVNFPDDPLRLKMPATDHEAILLAGKYYHMDISESTVPMLEFAVLFKHGAETRSFPVDSGLQEKIQIDPYALNLKQRFNPSLPECIYRKEDLKNMANEEGWKDHTENPYDFLKRVYKLPTFFSFNKGPLAGVKPLNNTLTIELENISEQDPLNIVLYGSREDSSNIQATSWSELIMTFESYREFRNPLCSSYQTLLDSHAVNKLIILAKKPCIDQVIAERRKRLVTTIEKINLEFQTRMNFLNGIKQTLFTNSNYSENMKEAFIRLYKLSLTMRSLKETDQVPENGGGGSLSHEQTQELVSLSAVRLHTFLHETDEWVRDTFLSLPLVIYYPRENKFSLSESNYEGHTIGGRLNIVHSGESTNAISSCLRLSSNWFLSTVYYYQHTFSHPIHFDITKLTHIG